MSDVLNLILGLDWWLRLFQRSPGRAVIVLVAEAILVGVLILAVFMTGDPRLEVLVVVIGVVALVAVGFWADRTAPKRLKELPPRPDDWTVPLAEDVDRIVRGSSRS